MSNPKSFYSDSKFWATEYFPKGIARSGQFTKEQASLLEDNGKAYQELAEGRIKPRNQEEADFVAVFRGDREAKTKHEKVWSRFLQVTNQKTVHYSVSSSSAPSVDFSDQSDSEL